jgi:hypothetical protein
MGVQIYRQSYGIDSVTLFSPRGAGIDAGSPGAVVLSNSEVGPAPDLLDNDRVAVNSIRGSFSF